MRVVSLLPAATEIMAYLGATEHLVGITHACDFPEVVRSRLRVTEIGIAGFNLHATAIRSLHPDLLLTQALCDVCAVRESAVRALAQTLTPVPEIITLHGGTIDGIMEDIRAVASAVDASDEADELLAGERARLRLVHDALKIARAPRPSVLVVEWADPLYVAGHWVPEQIHRAGGHDVLGSAGAHSTIATLAECEATNPEIVIVAPCGFSLVEARDSAIELRNRWPWLASRQLWAMDGNGLVSRPGPRVIDGVEAMARIFNPSLFSPLDPRHAVQL